MIETPPASPTFQTTTQTDGELPVEGKKLFVYDVQRNEAKAVRRESISSGFPITVSVSIVNLLRNANFEVAEERYTEGDRDLWMSNWV